MHAATPSSLAELKPHYDCLILGSGLAAAIVASRCAAAGERVAIFEPSSSLPEEPGSERRPFPHDPTWFSHAALPLSLREDKEGIARGEAAVAHMAGSSASEAELAAVYLSDSLARGADAFCGLCPSAVAAHADGWKIHFRILHVGRELFAAPPLFVTAARLVFAGGAEAANWLRAGKVQLSPSAGERPWMAEDGHSGTANHVGAVFTGAGSETYSNLYLAGSRLCSADVPPCPTANLAALTERQVHAWNLSLTNGHTSSLPSTTSEDGASARADSAAGHHVTAGAAALPPPQPPAAAGLYFTESMKGFVSSRVRAAGAFDSGHQCGKEEGSPLVFVLTLVTDNVERMCRDPEHPAVAVGTVVAPALDAAPLLVAGGAFNLFVDQADRSRRMRYRMQLITEGGRRYFFDGFKTIRDDPGIDVWADTTTLFVTIYDGPDNNAPVWGRGLLHILPKDFAKQLTTFTAFGARNRWQKVRAQVDFGRLFLGTLYETYVGAAAFLPDARARGGIAKIVAAKLAWSLVAAAALMLWIWPWRPAVFRNQPHIEARRSRSMAHAAMAPQDPLEQAHATLPPQYVRGLKLDDERVYSERHVYHCSWIADNIVQTHGALADMPFHPPDLAPLSELAIRRGFINLTRIRDGAGRVVGIGSQIEFVRLNQGALTRRSIDTFTDFSLTLPGKGMLFVSQLEGGSDRSELRAQAAKDGAPWTGRREVNRTLGPLNEGRGVVHAGTGMFTAAVGSFREFNILKQVPAHGDIDAESRYELDLLHAPVQPHTAPVAATGLALPAHATRALNPALAWRVRTRKLLVDVPRDLIYDTGGRALGLKPYPPSLGLLPDPELSHVRVLLAKLRDEHGAVIGLAAASSTRQPDGSAYLSQWTLSISGAGTLYVAPSDEQAKPPSAGFFGNTRGVILGGTGEFADVTGVVLERWPAPDTAGLRHGRGGVGIQFDVTLLSHRL